MAVPGPPHKPAGMVTVSFLPGIAQDGISRENWWAAAKNVRRSPTFAPSGTSISICDVETAILAD